MKSWRDPRQPRKGEVNAGPVSLTDDYLGTSASGQNDTIRPIYPKEPTKRGGEAGRGRERGKREIERVNGSCGFKDITVGQWQTAPRRWYGVAVASRVLAQLTADFTHRCCSQLLHSQGSQPTGCPSSCPRHPVNPNCSEGPVFSL